MGLVGVRYRSKFFHAGRADWCRRLTQSGQLRRKKRALQSCTFVARCSPDRSVIFNRSAIHPNRSDEQVCSQTMQRHFTFSLAPVGRGEPIAELGSRANAADAIAAKVLTESSLVPDAGEWIEQRSDLMQICGALQCHRLQNKGNRNVNRSASELAALRAGWYRFPRGPTGRA
jgi:hypothetical protein